MSYAEALEAAGAVVIEFEEFGSYQGDWWAKVRYKGVEGWVCGSYGSCSGCDAFEAEFGWDARDRDDYKTRLAAFGAGYLEDLRTQEEAEAEAGRYACYGLDDQAALEWLRSHRA